MDWSSASRPGPLYDFTAVDGVQHTIWHRRIGRRASTRCRRFDAVPALYIADGHHRAASAARARKQLAGEAGKRGEWDTFLAVAFPDGQVQILPYNRVVQDLAGMTPGAFMDTLRQRFIVTDGPASPARKGEVAMFLDGRWHTIVLGEAQVGARIAERLDVMPASGRRAGANAGIGDPRTDKRIDFVGGARGTAELESRVRSVRRRSRSPCTRSMFSDLMAITDAGGIMPPKSTWFEPKLRDGLLSHLV